MTTFHPPFLHTQGRLTSRRRVTAIALATANGRVAVAAGRFEIVSGGPWPTDYSTAKDGNGVWRSSTPEQCRVSSLRRHPDRLTDVANGSKNQPPVPKQTWT